MKTFDIDILICIVPKISPDAPTVGPAVLKSHLLSRGFTCEVKDLNIELYNEMKKNNQEDYFFEKDSVFKTRDLNDLDKNFGEIYNTYEFLFNDWIEFFKKKNPKYIGLSLLSYMSTSVALKLCLLIREHLPDTQIIWGGAEVSPGRAEVVKGYGLLDHFVSGDGEDALVNLMKGDLDSPGVNGGKTQLDDLNTVLVPNYDDIVWENYHDRNHPKPVYITGSRGCVKTCDFCNVFEMWPRYKFRSGEHIANEMITVREKYGRETFMFTDSLINGSMKAFRALLTILADYNNNNPDKKIKWHSQWIVRNKGQSPESDYKLMKESGCVALDVGIESFNERIRYELGKKFTDEDMWWCFKMLNKYQMHHTLLMFVGYPTETNEDHQDTLAKIRLLDKLGYANARSASGRRLIYFSFANTLMLDDGQPLWNKVKDDLDYYNNEFDWKYKDNTLDVRLQRLQEVNDVVQEVTGQEKTWMVKKKIEMIKKSYT